MDVNDLDLSPVQERTSLCDSESSSVANMNYSGPDSPNKAVRSHSRGGYHSKSDQNKPPESTEVVFIFCNKPFIKSCTGMLRILQIILSSVSMVGLTSSFGHEDVDFLRLPLSWHFRVMLFVLVLSLTTTIFIWLIHSTGLSYMLPVNWYFIDMVVYSVLSFLYLVGSSLVASAFDFYQKMGSDVPSSTIHKLILCVVVGYVCMFIYGLTALIGYRRWRIQQRLFKRKRLLDDEEDMEI
ncbi:uncharacterized protein LOC132551485 [Ylistrum balloti]|uniref:uncharacterized protein LOC132551485 n=1 Tax=Ylistrum balloti TaxID=509963 RepID=UPI00290599E3|nr:uncharacterized protein LOC132551485 [Ylistrum balloti]